MSSIPSIGITLSQWIKNIKVEILQISGECRFLFAHKLQIESLIHFLQDFSKKLSISDTDQHVVAPAEAMHFRQLASILGDIRALINNYTEQNFVNVVMNQKLSDAVKSVSSLRSEFCEHVENLHLNDEPLLTISDEDNMFNQYNDYQTLLRRLLNLSLDSKLQDNLRKQLISQIQEALSTFEASGKLKNSSENAIKLISSDEIKQTLQKFKDLEIDASEYAHLKAIGHGTYSEIYLGYNKVTETLVAIKAMNTKSPNGIEFEHFRKDIELLLTLKSPAILPLIGYSSSVPLTTITEYMPGGSLASRLHIQDRQLDPTKQTIVALGIAHGMAHLHKKGFVHHDLNSSTIYLDADDYPYIADFNLVGRLTSKSKNNYQQITPWTAPEMMISNKYDQKVDVYSYGIILWEILTRDVPFRGLSPFAIAHEVCDSNSRPLIPQNCPPKLSKLIEICWSSDPEKRPDFSSIVLALESGQIAFLGTNTDPIKTYISKFVDKEKTEAKTTGEDIDDLILKVKQQDFSCFEKLLKMKFDAKQIDSLVKPFTFRKYLTTFIDENESFEFIHTLSKFVCDTVETKSNADHFKGKDIINILIKLYKKFGTTSCHHFIDAIDSLLTVDNASFTTDCFKCISPFMLSKSINTCTKTIKLLLKVVEQKRYDNESSLIPIIPNLLNNMKSEMVPKVLKLSTQLCELLVTLNSAIEFMTRYDAPNTLLLLCLAPDTSVSSQSFKLLGKVLSKTKPTEKFARNFISKFGSFDSSSDDAIQPLLILSILSKSSEFLKIFGSNSDVIKSLEVYFDNKDETILGFVLRIVYSLVMSKQALSNFDVLGTRLKNCLSHPNQKFSMMASACLAAMLPYLQNSFGSILDSSLADYLKTSLKASKSDNTNDQICKFALRLTGSLSLTIECAEFIENNNILPYVTNLMKFDDLEQLALTVLASQSSQIPSSNYLIQAIPDVMSLLSRNEKLVITFVDNMAVDPKGAVEIVPYIEDILKIENTNLQKIQAQLISALYKIVSTAEARGHLEGEKKVMEIIVNKTLPLLESDKIIEIYKIYDILSTFENGKVVLEKYVDTFKKNLAQMEQNAKERFLCVRLVSRLAH